MVAGRIVAGPHVRDACARHFRDLEHGHKRGLRWDVDAVEVVLRYFSRILRLNGGRHEGKPFVVEPWQAFVLGSLFGWKNAANLRRFRTAYIETGKGSGKSPMAAGIGLYCLASDGEERAEVYAAAAKKDQAKVLFRDAVAMVEQSPALQRRLQISGGPGKESNIAFPDTHSFFRPLSTERQGKGQSGPRPSCVLLDEVHEHPTRAMYDFLSAGVKDRLQPLVIAITNSGFDLTTLCYELHKTSVAICKGDEENDVHFAYVCAMDEGDDPLDPDTGEACWIKANPSLGVTISYDYLRNEVRAARGQPGKESTVLRLNFCVWVAAESPWIDRKLWAAVVKPFERATLAGRACYAGLDMSGTNDLTALALYFPADGALRARAFVEFWTQRDMIAERERHQTVPYSLWVRQGILRATAGRMVDYDAVATRLGEIAAEFNLQGVAYDQYRIKYFEKAMLNVNVSVTLVPHGQGYGQAANSGLWMPRSVELLEGLISTQAVEIEPNAVLDWNAGSAVVESDAKGNRIFAKHKAAGKIDGVVALAMAVGYADENPVTKKQSPYETRGLRVSR